MNEKKWHSPPLRNAILKWSYFFVAFFAGAEALDAGVFVADTFAAGAFVADTFAVGAFAATLAGAFVTGFVDAVLVGVAADFDVAYTSLPSAFTTVLPISAGDTTTWIPHFFIVAIFSAAVPLPPEIIAPA